MSEKMYRIEMNQDFLAEDVGDALQKLGHWFLTASRNPKVMTNRDGVFELIDVIRLGLREQFKDE